MLQARPCLILQLSLDMVTERKCMIMCMYPFSSFLLISLYQVCALCHCLWIALLFNLLTQFINVAIKTVEVSVDGIIVFNH